MYYYNHNTTAINTTKALKGKNQGLLSGNLIADYMTQFHMPIIRHMSNFLQDCGTMDITNSATVYVCMHHIVNKQLTFTHHLCYLHSHQSKQNTRNYYLRLKFNLSLFLVTLR